MWFVISLRVLSSSCECQGCDWPRSCCGPAGGPLLAWDCAMNPLATSISDRVQHSDF